MSNQLLVFLKKPIAGKVKTRLAGSVGNEKAVEIYHWLIDVTRNSFQDTNAKVHLYFDDVNGLLPDWVSSYNTYFQRGDDLGERMTLAFKDRLNINPNSKLVLIGSDCPEISSEILNDAFQFLEEKDVVLGPATDGGIYLIGLKKWHDGLFDNIVWSTSDVFNSILRNVKKIGVECKVLQMLNDIDVEEDFMAFEQDFVDYKKGLHAVE